MTERMFHLSLYDYDQSRGLASKGYAFYTLLATLMRLADTDNLERLKIAFPGFCEMLLERAKAPGGKLEGEI